MARCICLCLAMLFALDMSAKDMTDSLGADSRKEVKARASHHQLRNPILNALYGFVKEFSRVDTNYVEPQHYNYTVMLQNTNTYEVYHLRTKGGQEIVFAPEPSYRLGPYFGWRWIFLGYTLDLTHWGGGTKKQDFNLSLYSNQIGVDLFYRKSGDDYSIRSLNLGDEYNTDAIKGADFNGFSSSIKGFNLYYIFNHRKFSYPAAYSQSTVQRRSAGSPMIGIGYTRHGLNIDWVALNDLIEEKLGADYVVSGIDSTMTSANVNYTDYSISGGYAYNWVFAHNWLFDVSLQAGLAYKRATSDMQSSKLGLFRDFDFRNFNLDGVMRLGVVYNNTRWYAGMSSILHAYNYRRSQFSTNNMFGSLNFYIGYNFGRR